jgi:hypothetical protein
MVVQEGLQCAWLQLRTASCGVEWTAAPGHTMPAFPSQIISRTHWALGQLYPQSRAPLRRCGAAQGGRKGPLQIWSRNGCPCRSISGAARSCSSPSNCDQGCARLTSQSPCNATASSLSLAGPCRAAPIERSCGPCRRRCGTHAPTPHRCRHCTLSCDASHCRHSSPHRRLVLPTVLVPTVFDSPLRSPPIPASRHLEEVGAIALLTLVTAGATAFAHAAAQRPATDHRLCRRRAWFIPRRLLNLFLSHHPLHHGGCRSNDCRTYPDAASTGRT